MKRKELQYQTVKPILRSTLERLMEIDEFKPFRLVGGTSLSLRYGHRMSDDIDLFTDAETARWIFIDCKRSFVGSSHIVRAIAVRL